jgi:hypothetical protein
MQTGVDAAQMTDALVQINDRLAKAATASGFATATFHCECGACPAEDVRLSLDEHDEIRAREDLIFAPGHDGPRLYRPVADSPARPAWRGGGSAEAEDELGVVGHLVRGPRWIERQL